ncbi:AAA family ATPase [Vibrio aestuarianus]|uniref:ATPase_AAA_core domain-containing protein n=1 Tax=Vibrio aestuarianus TaxID=28171 RepID=A0ABM9FKH1_9VIBR|nr:AAA family ATPase [Vibrio aestuarianus]MDE1214840.1 ATP-binding protein [Vibrio aestuarianus]MDE1215625.1 ATP-binding protein [Vibrio aestuarianus]MDE1218288.1 ATP-binding protein [Vibrio aestuarianus]MDE1218295.1 ATP-binding protein [Vibrio aestuarianus]MDE1218432.1 ATP-binding protein [Vibrio aestuarianus]
MKIFYHGQGSWNSNAPSGLDTEPNLLALSGNNWDDYGTKTTLNASLYFDGQRLDFDFHIKVLIEGRDYTAAKLNELRASGWDGFFPIPNCNYISLPSDIEFYSILESKLGLESARKLLEVLNDAGLQKNVIKDDIFTDLLTSPGFSGSLLRESGATKAFEDGWRIFDGSSIEIHNFKLNLLTKEQRVKTVPFEFESPLLPYDINVLIGPNGIGKSYSIKSLVEYWLKTGIGDLDLLKESGHQPFDKAPNFRNLILVSYSPFEEFELDLEQHNLQDKQAYTYFGFRHKRPDGTIGINRNLPRYHSALSIIKAIYDDARLSFIANRVQKFPTLKAALNNAFAFEHLALVVKDATKLGLLSLNLATVDGKRYLQLDSNLTQFVTQEALVTACDLEKGVVFLKEETLCTLSSGQRLFTYIAINVVGELKENSLVVIDEPELFLHPTLEIEFVSLLKMVLKPFKSKAILATHSLAVVREVPSKCVHIFRDEGHGLDVVSPPFETFGGDMQRISSYVFGDKSVTKPFEDFLVEQSTKYSPERLIELLGEEINEEMTMSILRLGRRG